MDSRDAAGPGCDGLKKIPAWMLTMTMTEAIKAAILRAIGRRDNGGAVVDWWCTLCLEDFEEGDEPKTMPCSHAFHPLCISGVLRIDPFCPKCQSALPSLQEKPSTP
uniref:RING-type domain-containing protein n=1 Tax=Leersia perrieri TaxID=77586 RepID=A0A0D9XWS8_9ORYZ